MEPLASYKNLVLIGFRGTGKTTISTALAATLGRPRFSTDDMASERCGTSIRDFVEQHGWEEFRRIERECVGEVSQSRGAVIDCGGGVVENPENMRHLAKNGVVVWIHADLNDVLKRLAAEPLDAQRPLLTHGSSTSDDVRQNYTRRLPLYEGFAAFMVNTSVSAPEECCRMIADFFSVIST